MSMNAVVVSISTVVIEIQVKDVLLFLRDHDVSPCACLSAAGSSKKAHKALSVPQAREIKRKCGKGTKKKSISTT